MIRFVGDQPGNKKTNTIQSKQILSFLDGSDSDRLVVKIVNCDRIDDVALPARRITKPRST